MAIAESEFSDEAMQNASVTTIVGLAQNSTEKAPFGLSAEVNGTSTFEPPYPGSWVGLKKRTEVALVLSKAPGSPSLGPNRYWPLELGPREPRLVAELGGGGCVVSFNRQ